MFTYLDFSEVVGGAAAACDRLPSAHAVYALFRNIKLSPHAPAEDFVNSIVEAISGRAAPDHRSKVGPMHKVTLECRSELSETKLEQLTTLSASFQFREFLSKVIMTGSLLQSPLYVGKASSLQTRIRQHLDPMSDLSVRLRQAGISINRCILAYALIDESPVPMNQQTMFLIEELMTRICRPGFVLRIG